MSGNDTGYVYDIGMYLADRVPQWAQSAQGLAENPVNLALGAGALGLAGLGAFAGPRALSTVSRRLTSKPGDIRVGYRADMLFGPPVHLAWADRCMHTQVIGPTGAGKTMALLPIAIQDLRNGHDVMVVEIYGDFGNKLIPYAEALGIESIAFDAGNPNTKRWNPLTGEDTETVAERAASTIKTVTNHSFYSALNADVMRNFVTLARDFAEAKDGDPNGADLEELLLLMSDRRFLKHVIGASKDSENEITVSADWLDPSVAAWFAQEYLSWSDKFRTESMTGLRNHLRSLLSKEEARRALCPTDGCETIDLFAELSHSFGSPRKRPGQGRLIVVRIPVTAVQGEAARTVAYWAVKTLQDATLSRSEQSDPLACYLDELPTLVGRGSKEAVEGFSDWMTLVRKHNVAVTVAYQGHDLLPDILDGVLETNGRNVLVSGGLGATDARRIQDVLGSDEQVVEDKRRTVGGGHRAPQVSTGKRTIEKHRYTLDEIRSLPRGQWWLVHLKNGKTQEPLKIRTPMAGPPGKEAPKKKDGKEQDKGQQHQQKERENSAEGGQEEEPKKELPAGAGDKSDEAGAGAGGTWSRAMSVTARRTKVRLKRSWAKVRERTGSGEEAP